MITKKYYVEITFPDVDILSDDLLQQIIFDCPELEDCLVNVYSD